MKLLMSFVFMLLVSAFSLADTLWIDVRSEAEHAQDNIAGDLRITHDEIVEQLAALMADKNADIHLYCRSGNRSGKAVAALEAAGYTNVTNAGSIGDARKVRGLN